MATNHRKLSRDITRDIQRDRRKTQYIKSALIVGYNGDTFDACKIFKELIDSDSRNHDTKIYDNKLLLTIGYIKRRIIPTLSSSSITRYIPQDLMRMIAKYYWSGLICCDQHDFTIKEGKCAVYKNYLNPENYTKLIHVNNNAILKKNVMFQFTDITYIIFCVSLLNYHQIDENGLNKLKQSMILCDKIFNHPMMQHIPILIYLTDKSKFEYMIQYESFNDYFDDYKGDNSYKDVIDFIQEKYNSIIENPKERPICACPINDASNATEWEYEMLSSLRTIEGSMSLYAGGLIGDFRS